jgi:DNA-binding CsgD family transcriptional regulator
VEALACRALSESGVRLEAAARIRHLIALDGFCVSSVDPDSLVVAATDADNIEPSLAKAFYENEYAERDFAKHEQLARSARRVRVLDQETRGDPARSRRFGRIVHPMGFEHELRAALTDRGTTWGFVHLYRAAERPGFDADEVAAIERAGPAMAAALKAAAAATPRNSPGEPATAPAVLLLDGDDRVLGQSGPLARWLAAMHDPARTTPGALPEAVASVAGAARRLGAASGGARVRVHAADGSWWTVHGSVVGSPPDPREAHRWQVTVVAQPATGPELAGIMMHAFGLSPGERAVCELLLAGLSSKVAAARLGLSPFTVQDRLKHVFAKAGVRSRHELVARLNPPG